MRIENTETNVIFDSEIEKLTGGSNTMGIEELLLEKARHDGLKKGEKKGIRQGKEQTIRNVIIKHGWKDEQIASVTEVSVDFVKKIRTSLKKQK